MPPRLVKEILLGGAMVQAPKTSVIGWFPGEHWPRDTKRSVGLGCVGTYRLIIEHGAMRMRRDCSSRAGRQQLQQHRVIVENDPSRHG